MHSVRNANDYYIEIGGIVQTKLTWKNLFCLTLLQQRLYVVFAWIDEYRMTELLFYI